MRAQQPRTCFTIMLLFIAATCATSAEKARSNLEKMDIPYSEDSFTQKVKEGNTAAVANFLAAGMDLWSHDGKRIYFLGPSNLWAVPSEGGAERQVTELAGRRGHLGVSALATDGDYLYFAWEEDAGAADIWVMDVVYDNRD